MILKKLLITICGILTALIIVELAIRFVVAYPVTPKRKQIIFLSENDHFHHISLYAPHSEFWSVEGGCRKFRRNNAGLPGTDITISDSSRYVFLAGSSFIEAYQVEGDSTASAIFQNKLQKCISPRLQVLNLGESKLDVYTAWFRIILFAEKYKPDKIVLAIEDFHRDWLEEYDNLSFDAPEDFCLPVESSLRFRISEVLVHYSSFLNLLREIYWHGGRKVKELLDETRPVDDNEMPEAFIESLFQFHESYGDDFLLVSFSDNEEINRILESFCKMHDINFQYTETILLPQNRFNGDGHLNLEGNRKLGEFLYEAFLETYEVK